MFRFKSEQEVALVRSLVRRRVLRAENDGEFVASAQPGGLLERLEAIPTAAEQRAAQALVREAKPTQRLAAEVVGRLKAMGLSKVDDCDAFAEMLVEQFEEAV